MIKKRLLSRSKKINWLHTCQKIGREVAREVRTVYKSERREIELGIGSSGDRTLEADKVAEDIIVKRLKELNVGIHLISEELGEMKIGAKTEYVVIVDPVDGSFNFKSGIEYFANSIAVFDKRLNYKIGYIINISNGNEYYAMPKKGAFKNGRRIHGSTRTTHQNVILESSHGATMEAIKFLATVFPQTKHARAPGAIALDFCRVADGTFDALLSAGASRFLDVAAGILIVREAGGIVTDFEGNPKLTDKTTLIAKNLLVTGNKKVHAELLKKAKK